MKHITLTLAAFAILFNYALSQNCGLNMVEVEIQLTTDTYASETSWQLIEVHTDSVLFNVPQGSLSNSTFYSETFCLVNNNCVSFVLYDSFGDGICCGYGIGSYSILIDGVEVATGGEFANVDVASFNCPNGMVCESANTITEGNYTAIFDDHWYTFTPDTVGTFTISTCGFNSCDTEIWVYDNCGNGVVNETNAGTIYYDDNEGGCGSQAVVTAAFNQGETYWIRIGDADDDCFAAIDWEIVYNGPVIGCTDPNACNYQPLATVSDGTCIYPGDPACPDGPDLLMRQDVLESSIYLTTLNNNDQCAISEGCLQGYGQRDILRFTTHIQNIGNQDYFIGAPSAQPGQFTFDNCHGHWHYDGYAEYLLFDDDGLELPIGFKNGFCVLDLECSGGGTAQYGCGNMGISAGCGDIYHSGLSCQWIDVTDVPDGRYTFVMRTNWDNAPDALGRYENETNNNWAQVCILLDRSSGSLVFSLDNNCDAFVDCAGEIYGSAQPDCSGVCNGGTIMGDLDANGAQEIVDAQTYVSMILGDDIIANSCNDLNDDGDITVYDATLMASCLNFGGSHWHPDGGSHDHCIFPENIENIMDTVTLTILDANFDSLWVDIGIKNPDNHTLAYEFEMENIMIMNAESLVDADQYPISPQTVPGDTKVIGISYEDSVITKSVDFQPLVRIHLMSYSSDTICIKEIIDIVNENYETVVTKIENGCVIKPLATNITNVENSFYAVAHPNPFSESTTISWSGINENSLTLELVDITGRIVFSERNIRGSEYQLQKGDLAKGVYIYYLKGESATLSGKLILQ